LRTHVKRSALVAVLAMATAGVVAPVVAAPALAAGGPANPFAGAGDFTVVSFGDVVLSNHEL